MDLKLQAENRENLARLVQPMLDQSRREHKLAELNHIHGTVQPILYQFRIHQQLNRHTWITPGNSLPVQEGAKDKKHKLP